jgi:hypothetical protein
MRCPMVVASLITLICLIGVGYHLDLCVAITFYWDYHFYSNNISS